MILARRQRELELSKKLCFRPQELRSQNLVTRTSRSIQRPSPEFAALLQDFIANPPRPLTLSKFLSFGRPLSQHSVLDSAEYVLSEIPRRLARRIRAIENLPFIVGTNPYIGRILSLHRDSFEWLAQHPSVKSLEDNSAFSRQLENLVRRHADDIPIIARGFQECGKYMTPKASTDFLDSTIQSRIAVRLIAEQHVAMSQALEATGSKPRDHYGVLHQRCSPSELLTACNLTVSDMCEATLGFSPHLKTDGYTDAVFPYIPVHLQYILTELLKNAFRATIERHWHLHGHSTTLPPPPVHVTMAPPVQSTRDNKPSFLSIRIRDEGGGIARSDIAHVFSYAFTTAGRNSRHSDEIGGGPYAAQHVGGSAAMGGGPSESSTGGSRAGLFAEIAGKGVQTGVGTLAGLGYGLPMSRLYAKYFGGSLDLLTLDGWGTDAIIKLRCLEPGCEDDVII